MAASPRITLDVSGLDPLVHGLDRVARALADPNSGRLGSAAASTGTALLRELRASAAHSPTPQARIVADAITVRRGAIAIGGGTAVGSRGTPAGEIVWGSERGGEHFQASRGGSYWIAPAVDRVSREALPRLYAAAVDGALRDGGVG